MPRERRLKFTSEDGKPLETVDFPEDTIVNGGEKAKLVAYVVNPEPNEYQVFETTHTGKNVQVSLETDDGGILQPNAQKNYKLTLEWSPPEGNDEPLKGKIIIKGRFIIRY